MEENFLNLAYHLAQRFVVPGKVEIEDLIQEARLSFLQVIDKYDGNRAGISTYVYINLIHSFSIYRNRNRYIVNMPDHIAKACVLCEKIIREISLAGKEEYLTEIISSFENPQDNNAIKKYKNKLKNLAIHHWSSYEKLVALVVFPQQVDEDLYDTSNDPTMDLINKIDKDKAIAQLIPLYQIIFNLRQQGLTFDEITVNLQQQGFNYSKDAFIYMKNKYIAELQNILAEEK